MYVGKIIFIKTSAFIQSRCLHLKPNMRSRGVLFFLYIMADVAYIHDIRLL